MPAAPTPPDPDAADRESLRAALRAGLWLGWTSVAGVAVALIFGAAVRHPGAVAILTGVGALAHTFLAALDWPTLVRTRRGRMLLDAWAAGVLVSVSALAVLAGGSSRLDLLLLLVVPFLAITHQESTATLTAWLVAAAVAFAVAVLAAPDPLPPGEALLHLVLLCGATLLGLSLTRAVQWQARGRAEATRRAALEGVLLTEAHHRVKNSLQVVADLLLLARPDDPVAATILDRAAGRIRSVATVHRALERRAGGAVAAPEFVSALVEAVDASEPVRISVAPIDLPADRAQYVGVVLNELLANAVEHGRPPYHVSLFPSGDGVALTVRDAGDGPQPTAAESGGLGLTLVEQVVNVGLGGTIERDRGAIRVTFPLAPAPA